MRRILTTVVKTNFPGPDCNQNIPADASTTDDAENWVSATPVVHNLLAPGKLPDMDTLMGNGETLSSDQSGTKGSN